MGNPHRKRGTGKGTSNAWQNRASFEGEPVAPEVFAQMDKKEFKTEVIDLKSRKPFKADGIHVGSSIPKSADKNKVLNQNKPVKASGKKPYSPKNDLDHWTGDGGKILEAVAEVLDKASDEKVAELEKEIAGFSPAEQRFIDPMDDDYSNEFWEERRKIEAKGIKATDRWVDAFRDSYINKRLGWGNDRKLAPEKKAILETYLNLKLPSGIPEEKPKNIPKGAVELNKESLKDLNKKNKHMEIPIKDMSPHPSAKFEDDKKRISKANDLKIDEAEFGKDADEKIKQQAYHLKEHRMSGDLDKQKEWEKKYGLKEDALTGAAVDDMLVKNGITPGTPEAQKFMQDWDWMQAKKVLRNQEAREQEEKENVDTQGKAEEPFYPPVVVPVKPEVYTAEPIPGEPQRKALEGSTKKTLEEFKADLDAKADAYAIARGNAKGSRGFLTKLLGMSKKGFSENVEEMEEVKAARSEYLQAKLEHSKAAAESAFKEYQDKLQNGTTSPEELETLRIKWEAISNYHNRASDIELQGKFVEKTVEYYKTKGGPLGKAFGKYLDLYNNVYLKKVPPKVRAAISIAMLGGAVAGLAGAFGATGIFLGVASVVSKPARFFLAPLFPAMTYTGTGKMIEKGLQWKYAKKGKERSAAFGEIVGKMKSGEVSVEDTRKKISEQLENDNKEYGNDLVNRGWWEDRWEQVRNLLTTVVGARATMVLMSGTEAIGSFFEGKGNMAGAVGVSPKGALYTQGSGGKTSITPEGMKAIDNSSAGSAKLSPEEYEKIGKHPYFSEPEAQTPEIAKPQFEEIASDKFGEGGSIERASNNILRAIQSDPSHYGLDPSNPNFAEQADEMRKEMIRNFYSKKGFGSYQKFDAYVRNHIQPNDSFDINYDSTAGKFVLDYQGKAFGGNVSHGGASAAHEISPSKGSISVDDAKPKAGAVVDHQPAETRGKTMQYDSDTPAQKIAKEHYAQAVQNQENLAHAHAEQSAQDMAELARINNKLYLDTRGLVNLIVNEAGVGNRANFWEHSMDNWKNLLNSEYQISQVERFNDATEKTNDSLDKLKRLYPILEKYHRQGIESIGDCLKEAVKDPANVLKINTHVLTSKR